MRDYKKLQRALDIAKLEANDVQDELEEIGEILLELEEKKSIVILPKNLAETIFAQMAGAIYRQKLEPGQLHYKCAYYETYEKLRRILRE